MKSSQYYIEKVLNNNAIVVKMPNKDSKILIGKGIGFHQKPYTYTTIHENQIEKSFFNYDETLKNQLIDLISYIDEDIIEVSNDIIALAETEFGKLNTHIYISLTDHISFAIDRIKHHLSITNPFQATIQSILKREYQIAKQAKIIIRNKLGVIIPEEEIGFIAFHINAARENIAVNFVVQEMRIYKEVIKEIEQFTQKDIQSDLKDDLYYIIQSIIKKQNIPLFFIIKKIPFHQQDLDKRCEQFITHIFTYIASNIDSPLTENQKNILKAYIIYITRNEA